jgi:chromosome segregation ATPase
MGNEKIDSLPEQARKVYEVLGGKEENLAYVLQIHEIYNKTVAAPAAQPGAPLAFSTAVSEITSLSKKVAEKDGLLLSKDKEIADLNTKLATTTSESEKMKTELASKTSEVESLGKKVEGFESEKTKTIDTELAKYEEEIKKLDADGKFLAATKDIPKELKMAAYRGYLDSVPKTRDVALSREDIAGQAKVKEICMSLFGEESEDEAAKHIAGVK